MRFGNVVLSVIAASNPLVVLAQPGKSIPRIGVAVVGYSACNHNPRLESLYSGLRDLGYVIGSNLEVDCKGYADSSDMRKVLSGFVAAKVHVIVAGGPQPAKVARDLTRDIPIVCPSCGDPVGNGLVASLRRPGGNVTGFASLSAELIGKRLGLLKEAAPRIPRVAALISPDNPGTKLTLKALDDAGRALGLTIVRVEYRAIDDLDRVLEAVAATGAGAILIQDDPFLFVHRKRIADFALKHRLAASAGLTEFTDEGVLMAYGPDRNDMYRRTAGYLDRILRGTKAGDLPFEQAAKLDFVVNLKTAKAIGLAIPESILIHATRIIE